MMIAVVTSLFVANGTGRQLLIPLAGGGVALLLFIAYSLWFWIKKPKEITLNKSLSEFSSYNTLYFLIVTGFKLENPMWYVFPVVCVVALVFIVMTKSTDEQFSI